MRKGISLLVLLLSICLFPQKVFSENISENATNIDPEEKEDQPDEANEENDLEESVQLDNSTLSDTEQEDLENEEKIDEKDTAKADLDEKPDNYPQAKVLLPIRRIDTSTTTVNVAPCGNVVRRQADTLTNKGSNIHVIWETIVPVPSGNCTVKISPGLDDEEQFFPLYPVNTKTDITGSFACGRVQGFESHEFSLPEDYVCDKCTIQWAWTTPVGKFYSCSDIIINGAKIEDCLGRCKNGGACFNGKCICSDGFYGEFCQKSFEEASNWGWILLVLAVLILLGLGGYYFFTRKSSHSWITQKQPQMQNQFIEKDQNPIVIAN